ncbi:uncharacterized protein EDB91DRAFT_1080324 [Suillus paluster]|uniref:uncharacterized protein n=1 Tax=Suillus paluster TaxID=48578 RepID=UPI001B86633E|nr:uncharacterized protein EDB91DRAFT_1080324 [Suillus paluster]KAG1745402.1 hypothetical protein EDB91DRAFT_1080324 [Suillus paluster]
MPKACHTSKLHSRRSGNCLDKLRFLQASNEAGGEEDKVEDKKVEGSGRPKVLADRTNATEMACTSAGSARLEAINAVSKPSLRALIGRRLLHGCGARFDVDEACAASTLIATSIIRVGQSTEKDSRVESESTQEHVVQVDDLLTFRQFSNTSADDPIDYVEDLGKATGTAEVGLGHVSRALGLKSKILIIDMVTVPNVDATATTSVESFLIDSRQMPRLQYSIAL